MPPCAATDSSGPIRVLPERIIFVDVETTGFHSADRVVSLAAILLETAPLTNGRFQMKCCHFVCDPGKKSHPRAEEVHGYTDWVLRHQPNFDEYSESFLALANNADLLVAHNADFDVTFINRELAHCDRQSLTLPVYCTMQGYRRLNLGGRATLSEVCKRIGIAREGKLHGALEDAYLAMRVFLWLHEIAHTFPFSTLRDGIPTSIIDPPPQPDGPLPRRAPRRRPSALV